MKSNGHTCNVLLVEDDTIYAALVASCLERTGLQVELATTAADARSLMQSHHYDVVIVDGLLPDGKGSDLCAEAQKLPSKPRVVFVTGHALENDMRDFLQNELGVQHVLSKVTSATYEGNPHVIEVLLGVAGESEARDDGLDADTRELMRVQQQAYLQALPERLKSVAALIKNAFHDQQAESLRALQMEVHKLHGSAGCYGLSSVSSLLEPWDARLKSLITRAGPLDPVFTRDLLGTVRLLLVASHSQVLAPA